MMRTATYGAMALLLGALGMPAQAAPRCAVSPADTAAIGRTVHALYAGLERDDAAAVARATTPGFYAYDVGKRLTAAELSETIRQAHMAGTVLRWSIGAIDTHVACDMAWAAWRNDGAVGPAADPAPVSWLESAALRRTGDGWRIDFLHSTRAAKPAR